MTDAAAADPDERDPGGARLPGRPASRYVLMRQRRDPRRRRLRDALRGGPGAADPLRRGPGHRARAGGRRRPDRARRGLRLRPAARRRRPGRQPRQRQRGAARAARPAPGARAWQVEAAPTGADLVRDPDPLRPWLLALQGLAIVVVAVLAAPDPEGPPMNAAEKGSRRRAAERARADGSTGRCWRPVAVVLLALAARAADHLGRAGDPGRHGRPLPRRAGRPHDASPAPTWTPAAGSTSTGLPRASRPPRRTSTSPSGGEVTQGPVAPTVARSTYDAGRWSTYPPPAARPSDATGGAAAGLFGFRTDEQDRRTPRRLGLRRAPVAVVVRRRRRRPRPLLDPGAGQRRPRARGPRPHRPRARRRGARPSAPTASRCRRTRSAAIALADIAPQTDDLAIDVRTSRGRVVAAVDDSFARRPSGRPGQEWLAGTDLPSRTLRLAGLPADLRLAARLLVANPSDLEAVVDVRVAGRSGTFTPDGPGRRSPSPPGTIEQLDLVRRAAEEGGRRAAAALPGAGRRVRAGHRRRRPRLRDPGGAARPVPPPRRCSAASDATVQLTAGAGRHEGHGHGLRRGRRAGRRHGPGPRRRRRPPTWSPGRRAAYVVVSAVDRAGQRDGARRRHVRRPGHRRGAADAAAAPGRSGRPCGRCCAEPSSSSVVGVVAGVDLLGRAPEQLGDLLDEHGEHHRGEVAAGLGTAARSAAGTAPAGSASPPVPRTSEASGTVSASQSSGTIGVSSTANSTSPSSAAQRLSSSSTTASTIASKAALGLRAAGTPAGASGLGQQRRARASRGRDGPGVGRPVRRQAGRGHAGAHVREPSRAGGASRYRLLRESCPPLLENRLRAVRGGHVDLRLLRPDRGPRARSRPTRSRTPTTSARRTASGSAPRAAGRCSGWPRTPTRSAPPATTCSRSPTPSARRPGRCRARPSRAVGRPALGEARATGDPRGRPARPPAGAARLRRTDRSPRR